LSRTFVYVSNADDGDIGTYALSPDGSLAPGPRVKADICVMPMAVSPDKRFLIAAARGEVPYAYTYAIDPATGALQARGRAPLAANCPYIAFDRSGRFLLGASYGSNQIIVQPVGSDGLVREAVQVVPTARHPHSIRTDATNRFVFVPHLGSDQVLVFDFDERSGRLVARTPPLVQLEAGCGPRHFVTSPDNRYVYVLAELTATVTAFALDSDAGLLTEVSSASALPADSTLVPGAPRGPSAAARDVSRDIWASDIHVTPDGRFIYAAERTASTLSTLRVEPATGRLAYVCAIATEKQPRGFRLDPHGRFMVVTGEKSETLSTYKIDTSTGALALIGKYPAGKGANWVEIVELP
jgi:6-phosphogluconolactonase